VATLKEDARLPVRDALLKFSNNGMALVSALKQQVLSRCVTDNTELELLQFASEQVEAISNKVINEPAETEESANENTGGRN
jgi:hypothetical protein